MNYLTEQKLYTVDDLEARVTSHSERIEELKASMGGKRERMEELQDLMEQADRYTKLKPIHDQMNAIKWKSKREQFKATHEGSCGSFIWPAASWNPTSPGGQATPLQVEEGAETN